VTAARTGGFARVTAVFSWDRQAELLATLRDGLESRITFSFRAFERGTGLLAILGDRLLGERTLTRSAYFDILDATYIVEEDGGARSASSDLDALVAGFFTADRVSVPAPVQAGRAAACYVAARVHFEPVRLMPPLTIVSLAGAAVSHTTPWVRAEVPR
jgi:hypothetical protein